MKLKNPVCLILAAAVLCCAAFACAEEPAFEPLTAMSLSFVTQAVIPEGAEAQEEELVREALDVMTRRLEALGYSDFSLRADGRVIYGDVHDLEDEDVMGVLLRPGRISFIDPDGTEFMTGEMIQDASYWFFEEEWGHTVIFHMTEEGAQLWADVTAMSIGRNIRIMLDDEVLLDATVQGAITGGECELSGIESRDQARMIVAVMLSGPMPVEFEEAPPDLVEAFIPTIEVWTEEPDGEGEDSDFWTWLQENTGITVTVDETE